MRPGVPLSSHADDYLAALGQEGPFAPAVGRPCRVHRQQRPARDRRRHLEHGRRASAPTISKFADPVTGQVAWFGVIEEHGHPAIMALRMKIEGGKIAEVEQIVTRKVENSPFPSIDTYVTPRPIHARGRAEGQARGARADDLARRRLLRHNRAQRRRDPDQVRRATASGSRTACRRPTTPRGSRTIRSPPTAARISSSSASTATTTGCASAAFPLVDEEKGVVLAGGVHRSHGQD